jgi:hypothetical protein
MRPGNNRAAKLNFNGAPETAPLSFVRPPLADCGANCRSRNSSFVVLTDPNEETPCQQPTKTKVWTARVLTGLAIAFLLLDAVIKVLQLPPAVQGTLELGFPASAVLGIGLLELACIVLYVTPRTSILGAILLTGYLGGAIASQVRVGAPVFSHILFPTYIAALAWVGLYLRDERLRILVPIRASA